jgi:hypothetical protein
VKEYLRLVLWDLGGAEVAGKIPAYASLLLIASGLVLLKTTSAQSALHAIAGWSALVVAAVLVVFVAPHRLWRVERNARIEVEESLYAEADIRGTIWYYPLATESPYGDHRTGSKMQVAFERCANHGEKECQLSELRIHLTDSENNVLSRSLPVNIAREVTCPRCAIPQLGAWYPIENVDFIQLENCRVEIYLSDSLGREYRNTITTRSDKPLPVGPYPFVPGAH